MNTSRYEHDAYFEPSVFVSDGRPEPGVGLAATTLILGVVGLLTCWLVVGAVPSIAAIALGLVVCVKAYRGSAGGWVMASTGAVLGVLGVVTAIAALSYVNQSLDNFTGRTADLSNCVNEAAAAGPGVAPRCS